MLDQIRTLLIVIGTAAAWAFGLATVWNKLVAKVNGLGGRVKRTEEAGAASAARTDEIKAHIAEMETQLRAEVALVREHLNDREIHIRERLTRVETTLDIRAAKEGD